jgi:LPS-assembly lipoprotein
MRLPQAMLLWFCLLCLAGCGFHLRGAVALAPPLQKMYLQTATPYGELAHNLRQGLTGAHAQLTNTPQEATTVLEILNEKSSQQLLSVGGTQQTRQYNLLLEVTFQVTTPKGIVVIPPQTVTEAQPLTVQADQILGGSNEQNNLYHQMRQNIVFTMMSRIASPTASALVMRATR